MTHSNSFNSQCYALLAQIPPGRVTTYKALAQALNSKAYQAVGNAMANNPNPITVPCHRVIKNNGCLGGYALGPEKKEALLKSEGIQFYEHKIINFNTVFFDGFTMTTSETTTT